MRTTLDIEESLYRRVKAKAALEGRTVTELVEAPAAEWKAEPDWKKFAGAWSGPGWEEDRKLVDLKIKTAFGTLEPEDRMSAAEVEASWKSKP